MRIHLLILFSTLCLQGYSQQKDFTQYVNPLIGTQKMGHTFPGATLPFGAVQLSPDTDTIAMFTNGKYNPDIYKYCAGYVYDDPTIVGFSHTHLSGTGHSDLGDFLIMPTVGKLQLNPGTKNAPQDGFRSRFSHATEVVKPDYYKVKLEDDDILAELTTTARVGIHQYTFPKTDSAHIILDLMHGIYNYDDKNVWTYLRVENDTLVTGYRQTSGWARTRTVYFAMTFSKPFSGYGNKNFNKPQYNGFWRFNQSLNFPEIAGEQIRAYFDFKTEAGEKIKIKLALSPVSTLNALENLRTEAAGWDFDAFRKQGDAEWNKELGKIDVTLGNREDMVSFYTALYHAYLSPTVYMDVNGEYKGLDQNIHQAKDFTNYTTFSLWDTYRALHPLFNIIQSKRNRDMIHSMLSHFDQSAEHMLPVWSLYANENWCMSGYHSVAVIADAVMKDNLGPDTEKALAACVQTARNDFYDGLGFYRSLGYVPEDKKAGTSVSTTLEFAYDDWTIAQMAKKLGHQDLYQEFSLRSQNWHHVYDSSIGFMRPRLSDGRFRKNFDVLSTNNQGFIEGNAWNFSLFVPQDPLGMIRAMGGDKRFIPHLDSLFTMNLPDKFFEETEDITREGIIGGYVHGNEPSHHVAYLYNFTSQPWKTQQRIRMILRKQYQATPDGLGGNDDCGQMSAWYVFSSMGFYPFAPGSDRYELGSPAITQGTITLENGKRFTIETRNQGEKNVYVSRVLLNGVPLQHSYLRHDEIMNGGTIVFYMSAKPNKKQLYTEK
ncbi:MAG: GH92 family glycosyl hydrolase [Flavisolibacter sp.]